MLETAPLWNSCPPKARQAASGVETVIEEVGELGEWVPGSFSAIYPVLRSMEEAGKIRRGYFVASSGNITDEAIAKYIEEQEVEREDDDFKVAY